MAASPTQADYKQEIRFAVVMYGGVSLAIYINGIAQELYHWVSATAREQAGATTVVPFDELPGTERVYRKLSYILANREFREQCQMLAEQKAAQKQPFKVPDAPEDDTVETRFVIDILSGTSAGGINGIFLAKALANNQNIDQLKELWVNEGDIGLLINDKRSVGGLGLENQQPPQSLLNSRRMYLKLLHAFEDMDKTNRNNQGESRFLDEGELDLFITTTDIAGLALPIRLSDSVVYERRHRNVFHFKYASKEATDEERNDFVSKNNPFLAFAARCTSSFPFAFEPMRLSDIDEVLDTFPEYRGNSLARGTQENWERFFNRNVLRAAANIADRPFGDGGYLDNKPFSFAADTMTRRQAALPVDRKLIYIEPSPEHPENESADGQQIDALRNVKAAILDLPAYETIREDLQRLIERNSLITRVNTITDAIERDLEDARLERPTLRKDEWKQLDLAGMVQRFGIYYIPYRRLRIEAATDELARTVARMLMLDEDSAEYIAVRGLIQAWREKTYQDKNERKHDARLEELARRLAEVTTNQPTAEQLETVEKQLRGWLQTNFSDAYRDSIAARKAQTQAAPAAAVMTANQFLLDYDFKYWLRRIAFVRSKVDQLLQLHKVPVKPDGTLAATDKQKTVLNRLNKALGDLPYEKLSHDEKIELKTFITELRAELIALHKALRIAGRNIQSPAKTPAGSHERKFAEKLNEIKLTPKVLSYLLGTIDKLGNDHPFSKLKTEDCANRARLLLDDPVVAAEFNAENLSKSLQEAADELRETLSTVLGSTWNKCEVLLRPTSPKPGDPAAAQNGAGKVVQPKLSPAEAAREAVRKYLWHYLSKFDDYDQVRFPIMYGTDGNESDVVEIFRISPEDAPSLIDERAESKKPNGRLKLAGTSLHHFGAFLDRVWRQNDIMWGRLDGAERLITMLLPYPDDTRLREALIKEAHASILREELSTESRSQLSAMMSEALIRATSGEPIEEAVERVMKELSDISPVKTRLATAINAMFDDDLTKNDDDKLVTFVKLGYQVNRRLDPKSVLETISRSTQTIGGIFEDLANRNGLDARSLSWIARLGQFFWGLVQVAVPNSILNKLATHWLYLLYMFELVIIVGGFLLMRREALQFGALAFAITAIANVIILLLKDLMRGRGAVKRALLVLLSASLGALMLIGLLKLAGVFGLRVGTAELSPLAWLADLASTAASFTGPLRPYLVYIAAILFVGAVLLILNLAGIFDFGRPSRKPESFKPIKLKKFKKRDMKDVHLQPGSGVKTYSITARLSAAPPLDWNQTFDGQWGQGHPDLTVKIYRDQLRFEANPQQVPEIWRDLQRTIDSVNQVQVTAVDARNQELRTRQENEKQRQKRELKEKWNTFKKLT